jgi:hypothetical protein
MAAYNKFNDWVYELGRGTHKFQSDTLKALLTNTAPVATNAVKTDITEITAQNGYSAGGITLTPTWARTGGTAKLTIADVTLTASGGQVGPFRYVVIYNDTPTSPADPLIGWYDRGVATTLESGDQVVLDFDDANGVLTLT